MIGRLDTPTYSFVIPVLNEEECLPELLDRLRGTMEQLDGPTEVIFVDDGSRDRSYELIDAACRADPRFRAIRFSRNFGHQMAITAGLDFAAGDAVIVMDADLQDPPEVALDLVARWRDGCDVVHAVREEREGGSAFKLATASLFYRLLAKIGDVHVPGNAGDFRLMDRRAVEAFKLMRENNRYIRGMFGWIGFRQCTIPYARSARFAGTTKFSVRKMMKFAFDGIISFSSAPLRLALRVGFILSGLAITAGIVAIVLKLSGALEVPGWTSMIFAITFLGGVQLLTIGVMGEYVSRIHDEVRGRPLYLVSETRGFERPTPGGDRPPLDHVLTVRERDPSEDLPSFPPR
jgi:polyisoprenyl-phosphate glycosyltransferase